MGPIIVAVVVVGIAAAVLIQSAVHRRRVASARLRLPPIVSRRLTDPRLAIDVRAILRAALTRGGDGTDVYDRISDRVDPSRFRPRLAPDVEVRRFPLRWGNDYAIIANPRAMIYFRLEPWEADMLPLMDGTRTVGEIIVERLEADGELDTAGASELSQLLESGGFLEPVPIGLEDGLTRALDPLTPAQRKIRSFMNTLSIDWSGADRFVRWWYRTLLWPFYRPAGVVLASFLAVGGLVAFFAVERSGDFALGTRSAPIESLILLGLDFVLTFFHELGHAATIVHYGRRVKSAGFMIYFGSPAFFVESSDALMLDRRQRIVQSFAGPFSELLLAGVASLVLVAFRDSNIAGLLYKFALINYFVIFLNLIPLLELDGYWILADLIQVPDLRQRSLQFIQHDLWHKLRMRERLSKQEIGLGLYAVIGVAFTILCFYSAYFFWKRIFGGLVTSLWNGGVGSRLLLVLLVVFFTGPALRGLLQLVRAAYRRIRNALRRVIFRAESRWRVEAAELIDALPAFDDLPVDVLNDLAGRVRLRPIRAGQPVFRQGDRPDAFYVVRQGRFAIEEEDPESLDVQVLSTLERGASFGEMGLLEAAPRAATVRSIDEGELFQIDKGTFDRLLSDPINAPRFGPTMQALAELRQLPPFAGLGSTLLAELLEHGAWMTFPPGAVLVAEGEESDRFYVLGSGKAAVSQGGDQIRTLEPGSYFGEIGLLRSTPRSATVMSTTPVRAFALDREGFERVVAESFRRGNLKLSVGRMGHH